MVGNRQINGVVNTFFNGIKMMGTLAAGGRVPRTGYHLVDPSPWPIIVRAGVINEAASFIRFVHGGRYTMLNFLCAT